MKSIDHDFSHSLFGNVFSDEELFVGEIRLRKQWESVVQQDYLDYLNQINTDLKSYESENDKQK